MNSERWERIEQLFHAALELNPEEREVFLDDACIEDPELRREIESLLSFDNPDESFLESPAIQLAARELADEPPSQQDIPTLSMNSPESGDTPAKIEIDFDDLAPGRIIGNYIILRELGAGGMGEVYLAEDLKLQRRVALKLLPSALGVASSFVERFRREARTASALNHPNIVTIHSIEEFGELNFIDMEYVVGETLKERLARGPLPIHDVLELGRQIAGGMQVAHDAGIIHRDLKPGNLLVNESGQIKIVDFGLAKMLQESVIADAQQTHRNFSERIVMDALSQAGSISGTIPYMSPEQTRGLELDARTDLFSLGCVLYEALTGKRPFQGETPREIIDEILMKEPSAPSQLQRDIPGDIDRIVKKSLAKDKNQRYQSALELEADLSRAIRTRSIRRTVKRLSLPVTLAVLTIGLTGWWLYMRAENRTWALLQLPEIERLLIEENQSFEAYDLAEQVARYLPDNERLREMKAGITDTLTIVTDPPGATVYLQRYQKNEQGNFLPRTRIGVTPIEKMIIARGDYLLFVEKPGYEPFQRTMSSAIDRSERGFWEVGTLLYAELAEDEQGNYDIRADSIAPIDLKIKLFPKANYPAQMVYVPGGRYRVAGAQRVLQDPVDLDDYWIDRYEVTNREYKDFVDAGGYEKREYWAKSFLDQLPVTDSGEAVLEPRTVTWEQMMQRFVDQTGKPGPRAWVLQNYPPGQADHPVTGVSWYEANAYAAFRGKHLPTVYQWEKAARDGEWTRLWGTIKPWGLSGIGDDLTDRTSVGMQGTVPVGKYPFGMSPFGCYDMCGNATEWCLNPRSHGFATMGSSWRDGPHHFGVCGNYPGLFRSNTIGFRCVKQAAPSGRDQGTMAIPDVDDLVEFHPVSKEVFELIKTHYQYDHEPLKDEVIETVETDEWTRLKIRYVGAKGQNNDRPVPENDRALAYLWLPKNANPPYQVIFYKPGAASYEGLTAPQETEVVCGPFLKAGRAVFEVNLEGMSERPLPPDWDPPQIDTVAYRDDVVYDTLDQRIGLDYLCQKHAHEIDTDRIASMALSLGGYDLVMLAVEERFQAHFLLSAGIAPRGASKTIREANPVNFAPYIRGPILVIHGRYDEGIPYELMAKPMFELFDQEKEIHVLESGHFPPIGEWYPIAQDFFDHRLGPVKLKSN